MGDIFEFEYGKDEREGVKVDVDEVLDYCIIDYEYLGIRGENGSRV